MSDFPQKHAKIIEHILHTFQDNSQKSPCGELKYPYLTPASAYSQELWDWDSYWIIVAMSGLFRKQKDAAALRAFAPHAAGCFLNFLDHQGPDGAIPIMIRPDCGDPFLCKSSAGHNLAKPFLAQMGKVLWDNGMLTAEQLKSAMPRVRAFHQCYRGRFLHPETGLVVWGMDWGIGVDDDPAAWGRPAKSCASVFLNSFLYRDYRAAESLAEALEMPGLAEEYRRLADGLGAAIERYCYDARENAYFSVDVQCHPNLFKHPFFNVLNKNLDTFWHCLKLKVLSWSAILPFWCGLGSDEAFAGFVKENLVPERLMGRYGVRSLSAEESMYAPEVGRGNPSNWLGPVWVLSSYVVWDTLRARGYVRLADQVAETLTGVLCRDVEENGLFHEYYSPETGRGIFNEGFMSWNSLAALVELQR